MHTGILVRDESLTYSVVDSFSGEILEVMQDDTRYLLGFIGSEVQYETLESMPPKATNIKLYTPKVRIKRLPQTKEELRVELKNAFNTGANSGFRFSFEDWYKTNYGDE